MKSNRQYRVQFRHARRHSIRWQLGRLPLVRACAIGVAAVGVLPASQAFSSAADVRTDQAAVANMSAAPNPTPATTNASPAASKPAATKAPEPPPPAKRELRYTYAAQINGWFCGPAAARIALTTRGLSPSQDALANQLGTTENGTNSSEDIARVLNAVTKTSYYHATSIPDKGVTKQQVNQFEADVVRAISHGYGVVTNVVGSGQDVGGNWYSYDGGHYIAVVGYQDNGRQVKIADPANPYSAIYWMTAANLAEWVGTRGYAS
jgi:hypothetical protein